MVKSKNPNNIENHHKLDPKIRKMIGTIAVVGIGAIVMGMMAETIKDVLNEDKKQRKGRRKAASRVRRVAKSKRKRI